MFTGIVTHIGRVVGIEDEAHDERTTPTSDAVGGRTLEIEPGFDPADAALGASIAHSGVCLTVVSRTERTYRVQASAETLARATLGGWRTGTRVNLERSLKAGDELGGHLVFGHVDGLGEIQEVTPVGDSRRIVIGMPPTLAPLVAVKGSIAVDGISLTVNEVAEHGFAVMIIPHTWSHTTLADRRVGDPVNLEADMLARYVARQLVFS